MVQLRGAEASTPLNLRTTRKMGNLNPIAPLPGDLTLPVQHLLPHGRYCTWQLRPFDPPMRPDALVPRLNSLLRTACDGAVRFGEQPSSATAARVPVPPSELVPTTSREAETQPPHGVPGPSAGTCIVVRAERRYNRRLR